MFSLYIHWPFCLSKCPYCDFNSHVRKTIDEGKWCQLLIKELKRTAQLTGSKNLSSIFFGGGTPSLMSPKTVESIITTARNLWNSTDSLEITLEANPNSVEVQHFHDLSKAGVNRLSIGIQALNDKDLKALGRQHNALEALKAIEIACSTFSRVSFDLIYARENQTLKEWQHELKQALEFNTEHLSLYQLTIEEGTVFSTLHKRGDLVLPSDNLSADLFELTQNMTAEYGLPYYEVSNYSKPSKECRHNLTYWHYQDYAGIGPGAHGRLTLNGKKFATRQKKSPEMWIKSIEENGHGDEEVIELSLYEQTQEMLLMGLRLKEGINLNKLPLSLKDVVNIKNFDYLIEGDFLKTEENILKTTPSGHQRLNAILNYLCIA